MGDQTPIKVVNILEHTTGFDEIHAHNVSGEGLSTKECLEADWRSRKSRWMPGTYYSYCNSAVPMLAFAIEKKTEQSFEDYVKYNVLLPIRMSTSSYFFTPYVQKHLAKGYSYKDGQETPYRHSLMRCSGALTTNATEMSSFIQMMLNRGRIDTVSFLSPESITRMETPTTSYTAKIGVKEGYGLGITSTNYKGFIFYGHSGGYPGYLSNFGYNHELGLGFVMLYNTGDLNGNAELLSAIMDFILKDQSERKVPEFSLHAGIKDWEGYYRMANSRAQVTHFMDRLYGVTQYKVEDGKMMTKSLIGGQFQRMKQARENVFYTEDHYGFR